MYYMLMLMVNMFLLLEHHLYFKHLYNQQIYQSQQQQPQNLLHLIERKIIYVNILDVKNHILNHLILKHIFVYTLVSLHFILKLKRQLYRIVKKE